MKIRKQIDWLKLEDFKNVIAKRISEQLPDDHGFTIDDIKSEVDGAYLSIIKTYKPKEDGNSLSLESYCWKYAYKIAFNSLLQEYSRLKLSTPIFEGDEDDEEEQSYCERLDKLMFKKATSQEIHSNIDDIQHEEEKKVLENLAKEDPAFYPIYREMLDGKTEREIAKKLNISQAYVHKIIDNFINTTRENMKGTK